MKSFKGVSKGLHRKITDQMVKHAQAIAHLSSMSTVANNIVGGGGADVADRSPELTFMLHPVTVLTEGGQHAWNLPTAAIQFRKPRGDAALHVPTQGDQIAHHEIGSCEHLGVDALHHKGIGIGLPCQSH